MRTVCFRQPAVPIHARRFAGEQQIVLTIVESDAGHEGYAMARAHGGQSGRGLAEAIVQSLAPRVVGQPVLSRDACWQAMVTADPANDKAKQALIKVEERLRARAEKKRERKEKKASARQQG